MKFIVLALSLISSAAFAGEITLSQGSYCANSSSNQGLGIIYFDKEGSSKKIELIKASKEKNGCYTVDLQFRDTGKKFNDATLCEYPGSC